MQQHDIEVNIFIAYAPEDVEIFNILYDHLSILKRTEKIKIFCEKDILGGQNRLQEIEYALTKADIILLLFSSQFIRSDFYYNQIGIRALNIHRQNNNSIVPIILRECLLEGTPFENLQNLPRKPNPVISNYWSSKDEPFILITKGVKQLVKDIFDIGEKTRKKKTKTKVIRFTAKITAEFTPQFNEDEIEVALTDYSANTSQIKIHFDDFNKGGNLAYWTKYALQLKTIIKDELFSRHKDSLTHISIFGFAPIPLLIYLGHCVGDKIPVSVFPVNRNTHPNDRLIWLENSDYCFTKYIVKQVQKSKHKYKVALLVSLSDYIARDKYIDVIDDSFNIYEITIEEPSKNYLKSEIQVINFAIEFCKLLNKIQANHGKNTPVHVLPAIPTAISVKIGLSLLPTKDQPLWIYDYSPQEGFRKVLELG